MATLINRIQRAMLGSAGPQKVRALLIELAIPAGGSGENALRESRRGFLRPISQEAILRNALDSLGLTGGGTGARPLTRIRSALLHNLVDSETTLRDGLNDLLGAADLVAGSGEPPTDIFLSASTVAEDAELGHVVGVLSATDPELDDVTFTLVDDAGGLFGIDGTNLIVTGVLDYETADEEGGGGGEPELLADINFADGSYTVGGSPVVVGDIFATDAVDGTVWDAGDIIPGSGLRGEPEGGTSIPSIIGALRTAIVGTVGSTVLFEFTVAEDAFENLIQLDLYDTPGFEIDIFAFAANNEGSASVTVDFIQTDGAVASGTFIDDDATVNKFIVTLSKTLVACQINQGTPAETVVDPEPDWTQIDAVALYRKGYKHLRRIRVYAPLTAAGFADLMVA